MPTVLWLRTSTRRRLGIGFKVSAATTASIAALTAASGAMAQSATASGTQQLQEIVVTAQKRSESALRVPITLQAFSETQLQNAGITNVTGLSTVTPGLTYDNNATIGRLYIRGVGNDIAGNGLDPSVATYLDDRYEGHATGALFQSFLDIGRVEVLKGPQGTLFGRNATGGAIRLISNDVTDVFTGSLRGTAGNYDLWALEGVVNIPVTQDLGIRLAAETTNHSGYYTNLYAAGRHDWFDQDSQNFRGKIRWDMTSNLKSTLTVGYWQKHDLDGTATVVNGPPLFNPYVLAARVRYPAQAIFSTAPPHVASDITHDAPAHELSGEYRLDWEGDWFNFASITTGQSYKITTTTDPDSTAAPILNLVTGGDHGKDYSQEFQFSSKDGGGKFRWLAGFYYYHSDDLFTSHLVTVGVPFSAGGQDIVDSAWSLYANGTYSFTQELSLDVGGRYSEETKRADLSPPEAGEGSPLPPFYYAAAHLRRSWVRFTPSVSLNYNTNWGLVYAKFSEGFKSGGFNYPLSLTVPVNPEFLYSYEVGVKGLFYDGRVRTNADVFYYDYKDLQVTSISSSNAVAQTQNAAAAKVQGVELDGTWLPFEGVTVQAGGSYTDGTYSSFPDAAVHLFAPLYPLAVADESGSPLHYLSKWQYFMELGYKVPLANGSLATDLTWTWRSSYAFDFGPSVVQPAYGLLNGRITYTLPDKRWNVSLWANNITDQVYYAYKVQQTAGLAAPRTFGAEVEYRF